MTSLRRGMSAFQHRNYRLFFIGQAISLVGTWMQQVAQSWLVLVLTHDPLWLGVVAAAQFIPVMIFGLFGGILADNLPKRQTLLCDPGDQDVPVGDPGRDRGDRRTRLSRCSSCWR